MEEKIVGTDGKTYAIRYAADYSSSWEMATKEADTALSAMSGHLFFQHRVGPKYGASFRPFPPHIIDPISKLDEYITQTQNYKSLLLSFSRKYHLRAHRQRACKEDSYTYYLFDDEQKFLVGHSTWTVPRHMVTPTNLTRWQRLFRSLYASWLWVKYKTIEFLTHYLEKDRYSAFLNIAVEGDILEHARRDFHPLSEDELSRLSYEELQGETFYPQENSVYLYGFFIHPDYQRKGLGLKFLTATLDKIPNTPAKFTSANGNIVAYGPQKVLIDSTQEGEKLYAKLGFKNGIEVTHTLDMEHLSGSYKTFVMSSNRDCIISNR